MEVGSRNVLTDSEATYCAKSLIKENNNPNLNSLLNGKLKSSGLKGERNILIIAHAFLIVLKHARYLHVCSKTHLIYS